MALIYTNPGLTRIFTILKFMEETGIWHDSASVRDLLADRRALFYAMHLSPL